MDWGRILGCVSWKLAIVATTAATVSATGIIIPSVTTATAVTTAAAEIALAEGVVLRTGKRFLNDYLAPL